MRRTAAGFPCGSGQPFAGALSQLVELLASGHPVTVAFHAEGMSGPLHDLVVRELLLVAQEAVSNAVHHGSPSHLGVSVAVASDAVEVVIRDNGCGFATGEQPGRGTTVVVRVPEPLRPPAAGRNRFVAEKEAAR